MTASQPMPEPKWGFRRFLVYVVVAAILFALHRLIGLTAEHIIALVKAWRGSSS